MNNFLSLFFRFFGTDDFTSLTICKLMLSLSYLFLIRDFEGIDLRFPNVIWY